MCKDPFKSEDERVDKLIEAERRLGGRGAKEEHNADGCTDVTLHVSHLDAFIGWILSFGDQAEVLHPDSVRQAVIDRVLAVQP
jgi:predicted DNA-binding transcriptional regulator YafY